MRFLSLTLVSLALMACSAAPDGPEEVGSSEDALARGGLGATGDACEIDLPDGLKEPGTRDASGKCCSVFHPSKCQDSKGTITNLVKIAR